MTWTEDDFRSIYLAERRGLLHFARSFLPSSLASDDEDIVSEALGSAWKHRETIESLSHYIYGSVRKAAIKRAVRTPLATIEIPVLNTSDSSKAYPFDRQNCIRSVLETPEEMLLARNRLPDIWATITRKLSSSDRQKLQYWRERDFTATTPAETARLLSLRKRIQAALSLSQEDQP